MNLSIFDVIGPIMIGPSSSHTAGAVKLARVAARIAGKPFKHVEFGLHGSFAKTGKGHGTHLALLAGVLGLTEEDERIKCSPGIAEARGITYKFYEVDLDDVHENTAVITFTHDDDTTTEIVGCSTGGGRILITRISGVEVEVTAERPTIIMQQIDRPGVIAGISRILAENNINIGVMRFSRVAKRDVATSVLETDEKIPPEVVEKLAALDDVLMVRVIQ
ncbi:MAG TPA: L-serine ammonia-lyase, iron-sulfur-dependent subunit beta [Bacillota bacterium]|nr:L-serine ammonia-lyase, iron-sulfur-dependent subunit beta [Bacillota bacterium]HPT36305.1 L-serine ammonia-lyase, iron-sulfur-dependent subunit beta [Bacillota bacterium]HPZ86066.1 L-serine ammonia-lyase, iron-sulfur-dependent subunit beta [Bacillota bacterium]HQD86596.1 L-serine ammonia-lyase, iron-sulfur-dependent subunit beta [Bacillota bacterium]